MDLALTKINKFTLKNSPDSLILDDNDLVSSNEFVLDKVEVEHSDRDLLLHIASLYWINCSQRHFKNICFLLNCSMYTAWFFSFRSRFCKHKEKKMSFPVSGWVKEFYIENITENFRLKFCVHCDQIHVRKIFGNFLISTEKNSILMRSNDFGKPCDQNIKSYD